MSAPVDSASPEETIDPTELAAAEAYHSKENFIKLHKSQFQAMKLPASLMTPVYNKFLNHTIGAEEQFQVQYMEDEGFQMVCNVAGGLKANADVWILDHLWTTSAESGPKQLREIDGLMDRLWTLADMDLRLQKERDEAAATTSTETTATATGTTAPPTAAASAATSPDSAAAVDVDEDTLCAIMSEAHVSRQRALEAYQTARGDLINAINSCAATSEAEKQMEQQMGMVAEQQAEAAAATAAATTASTSLPADLSTLTSEQKCKLLWEGLFKHRLMGSYFTTLQTDKTPTALSSDDVQLTLYVNDEIGSAVGQVSDAANANAIQAPLVLITLGGVGFTLMWLTKDVQEGEEILIAQRPTIRAPGVPTTRK